EAPPRRAEGEGEHADPPGGKVGHQHRAHPIRLQTRERIPLLHSGRMARSEAKDEEGTLGPARGAGVMVYAAASGLLTSVPVPFLDSLLGGLARGAALRRIAGRHGVRLTREARDVLAAPRGAGAGATAGRALPRLAR